MSETNISQRTQLKRKSVKAYASSVLRESTVGIVSSIAQAESKSRKVFKFPTSIGIDVTRPNKFIVPAYTFCDNNGINRRIFCQEYTSVCEAPSDDLCHQYKHYCGKNRTVVPQTFLYDFQQFLPVKKLINLNEKITAFIDNQLGPSENITGPHIRLKEFDSFAMYLCYSLNDRVNSPLYPATFTPGSSMVRKAIDKLSLTIRFDEMFIPGNRAGILFDLHSPFQAVNPFETGTFLKTGRSYMIYVTMEEHILEKSPYDTDCINYTEVWEKNGRSGPRTQEMCKQNCFSDILVTCDNCNSPYFLYPRHERFCDYSEIYKYINCTDGNRTDEMIEECKLKCKNNCREIKFQYTVQERFKGHYDESGVKIPETDNVINIHVYLKGAEVKVFKHSPRYMTVEAFSSIGGFIGIWLGLSLLDIADVFEAFCRIILYSFKKTS